LDDCHHTFTGSERQAIVSMLNSGSRQRTPYAFGDDVYYLFGPKAFASNAPLPRSLASRCIPIVLRRKKPAEAVVRFDLQTQADPIQDLRNFMKAFCDASMQAPKSSIGEPAPNMPPAFTAHQQDCAEPLLHLANLIGGSWAARARAAIVAVFQLVEDSEPIQVLADIRASFLLHGNPVHLTTADLLASLISCEDRPWSSWPASPLKSGRRLRTLLRRFGIESDNLRLEGDKILKGYKLVDFQDAWERYLQPLTHHVRSVEPAAVPNGSTLRSATESASATPSATANSLISNSLQGA
jgi:putative DNA primase/helicase